MIGFSELDLRILRTYLFGEDFDETAPDLLSSDRIRQPQVGEEIVIDIDMVAYMNKQTGAGRFATGAMFDLVNVFFLSYGDSLLISE